MKAVIFGLLFCISFALSTRQVMNITRYLNTSVLFVGAHPDDIEAMAGGFIRALVKQGTTVHYVIMTNGDKGEITSIPILFCSFPNHF